VSHVLTPHVAARRGGARFAVPGFVASLLAPLFALALGAASCSPALAQKTPSTPVLPGGDSKEPINIDAAKLDYFDKEQKLVYTGDVVATQGESRLKASALVLYLTPKNKADQPGAPSSSSQLRRMEASGPVTVVSKDQIGTGDSGVYEKAENKVYLIGNVTLTQGPNVTKGDKLIYDLTTSQAVVTGRVRSMFIPNNGPNNGQNAGPNAGAEGGGVQGAGGGAPVVHKKPAKTTP
jgi:lipopolysaccharide export system protein LptA